MSDMASLREMARKPVRIASDGTIFIGEAEFAYPVEADSVTIKRAGRRCNRLTLTIFVGAVTVETNGEAVGIECIDYAADGG